jgi:hypothetical protein
VPIISADGSENIMEAQYVPGFPVLVLKESERVIDESGQLFKKIKQRNLKTIAAINTNSRLKTSISKTIEKNGLWVLMI